MELRAYSRVRWAPILGIELMALPGPIAPHIHKVIHYKYDELEEKFVPILKMDSNHYLQPILQILFLSHKHHKQYK